PGPDEPLGEHFVEHSIEHSIEHLGRGLGARRRAGQTRPRLGARLQSERYFRASALRRARTQRGVQDAPGFPPDLATLVHPLVRPIAQQQLSLTAAAAAPGLRPVAVATSMLAKAWRTPQNRKTLGPSAPGVIRPRAAGAGRCAPCRGGLTRGPEAG